MANVEIEQADLLYKLYQVARSPHKKHEIIPELPFYLSKKLYKTQVTSTSLFKSDGQALQIIGKNFKDYKIKLLYNDNAPFIGNYYFTVQIDSRTVDVLARRIEEVFSYYFEEQIESLMREPAKVLDILQIPVSIEQETYLRGRMEGRITYKVPVVSGQEIRGGDVGMNEDVLKDVFKDASIFDSISWLPSIDGGENRPLTDSEQKLIDELMKSPSTPTPSSDPIPSPNPNPIRTSVLPSSNTAGRPNPNSILTPTPTSIPIFNFNHTGGYPPNPNVFTPSNAGGGYTNTPPTTGGGYTNAPPTTGGGYTNTPPKMDGSYTNTPPKMSGGYTNTLPKMGGSYTNTPPKMSGGYSNTPPNTGGGYTNTPPNTNEHQIPSFLVQDKDKKNRWDPEARQKFEPSLMKLRNIVYNHPRPAGSQQQAKRFKSDYAHVASAETKDDYLWMKNKGKDTELVVALRYTEEFGFLYSRYYREDYHTSINVTSKAYVAKFAKGKSEYLRNHSDTWRYQSLVPTCTIGVSCPTIITSTEKLDKLKLKYSNDEKLSKIYENAITSIKLDRSVGIVGCPGEGVAVLVPKEKIVEEGLKMYFIGFPLLTLKPEPLHKQLIPCWIVNSNQMDEPIVDFDKLMKKALQQIFQNPELMKFDEKTEQLFLWPDRKKLQNLYSSFKTNTSQETELQIEIAMAKEKERIALVLRHFENSHRIYLKNCFWNFYRQLVAKFQPGASEIAHTELPALAESPVEPQTETPAEPAGPSSVIEKQLKINLQKKKVEELTSVFNHIKNEKLPRQEDLASLSKKREEFDNILNTDTSNFAIGKKIMKIDLIFANLHFSESSTKFFYIQVQKIMQTLWKYIPQRSLGELFEYFSAWLFKVFEKLEKNIHETVENPSFNNYQQLKFILPSISLLNVFKLLNNTEEVNLEQLSSIVRRGVDLPQFQSAFSQRFLQVVRGYLSGSELIPPSDTSSNGSRLHLVSYWNGEDCFIVHHPSLLPFKVESIKTNIPIGWQFKIHATELEKDATEEEISDLIDGTFTEILTGIKRYNTNEQKCVSTDDLEYTEYLYISLQWKEDAPPDPYDLEFYGSVKSE